MRSTSPASRLPTAERSTSFTTGRGRHPGSRVPARGPRGRLPIFHHRPGARRGRVPLQPHPSRSRQSRLDRYRPPAHLQADASARLLAAPQPRDGLPPAPDIEEPLDIAHLSAPAAAALPRDARRGRAMDPTAPCRQRRWARAIPRRRPCCRPEFTPRSTGGRPRRSETMTTRALRPRTACGAQIAPPERGRGLNNHP